MSENPIRIKSRTIDIINESYNTTDGDAIYKEVQEIIILSVFCEEMMTGARFVHFFIRQLAMIGALSNISLVDLARKFKSILDEFETDTWSKNYTVQFIRVLLVKNLLQGKSNYDR